MSPIDRWLSGYLTAWREDTPENIAALFEPDAKYFTTPSAEPRVGPTAIAEWWQGQDEGSIAWEFEGGVIASEGSLHVVQGVTTYPAGDEQSSAAIVYDNIWLVELAESGRAKRFVEYWMKRA